jgi:6-pyruvoyltetrahydropterin/6-carboxytetrahydropterin synthase
MESITVKLVSSYAICAGHRLSRSDWSEEKNRQVFGKCTNNHGHQYNIEVHIQGPVNAESGMLINGFDVDEIVRPIIFGQLDHKFLNDDVAFFKERQPTAEWIACYVFNEIKDRFPKPVQLTRVRVRETPELYAEYPAT